MSNSLQPHQAPLSMGFSRQEYWSGLPCPSPGESSKSHLEFGMWGEELYAAFKKHEDKRCADVTDPLFLWDHMISGPISKLICGKNIVHTNTRGKYKVDFKLLNLLLQRKVKWLSLWITKIRAHGFSSWSGN